MVENGIGCDAVEKLGQVGRKLKKVYTLGLTNMEVEILFSDMVKNWFGGDTEDDYNDFIKALLLGDKKAMNRYMNKVALATFSSFDIGNKPSKYAEPERFYHGFVLGSMVELADRYSITSNRESGFGRYDVMLEPLNEKDDAIIIEFKVYDLDDEETLADTVETALFQIEEKCYSTVLETKGIVSERIRKYGFAFKGKTCLMIFLLQEQGLSYILYSKIWKMQRRYRHGWEYISKRRRAAF